MNAHTGPAPYLRLSQKGVPPGWIRIAVDQIEHKSKRVRIKKLVFRASGGGKCYRVWFKDRRNHWCSVPKWSNELSEAIDLGEQLATTKEMP